jgi:hypothetical protein
MLTAINLESYLIYPESLYLHSYYWAHAHKFRSGIKEHKATKIDATDIIQHHTLSFAIGERRATLPKGDTL